MSDKTAKQHLNHIAEAIKNIDFVMLNTHTANGQIGAGPMNKRPRKTLDYDTPAMRFNAYVAVPG